MTYKRFIISDVLGFGWKVMKANFWFFVGLAIVAVLVNSISNITEEVILQIAPPELVVTLLISVINIIGMFISMIIGISFTKIALSFCDSRKPAFGTLFDFQDCFWRYLGTHALYMLIVFGGFLLLIVPGIIWLIKYGMCYYFVIDKGLGPVQALKASGRTTMGVKWELFGFGILCSMIILLGLLCLIVGVFAAYPIVLIANALVYRHLLAQTPELAQFGIGEPPAPIQAEPQQTNPYQQPPQQIT
jgi:uncharacterized membrane protein